MRFALAATVVCLVTDDLVGYHFAMNDFITPLNFLITVAGWWVNECDPRSCLTTISNTDDATTTSFGYTER